MCFSKLRLKRRLDADLFFAVCLVNMRSFKQRRRARLDRKLELAQIARRRSHLRRLLFVAEPEFRFQTDAGLRSRELAILDV